MKDTKKQKRYGLKKHAMTIRSIMDSGLDFHRVEWSDLESKGWHCKEETFDLPEGWTFLGNGWSRRAVLGPDGKVYKVGINGGEYCSEDEARIWQDKHKKAKSLGVHLARCYWHEDAQVLTMEYCPKARDLDDNRDWWRGDSRREFNQLGISDCHNNNVWIDTKGRKVAVDYAG